MFSSFKFALQALQTNKIRAVLSILGVVIGIAAVIIVMSAGEGLKSFILGQIEVFGSDTIQTEIKIPNVGQHSPQNATGIVSGISITTFKNQDVEALRQIKNIKAIYGAQMGQDLVSYKNIINKINLVAVESDFSKVDKSNVELGRFFTDQEDKSLKQVAILGSKVKNKLFDGLNPLNQEIKIGKLKFRVVGVLESRGAVGFMDLDDQLFIPLRTYQKKMAGIDHVLFALSKVDNVDLLDETAEEMREVLRRRHNITDPQKDDFAVTSMVEATEMLGVVINGIIALLIALVTISLIVGGVGIMNIMYVAVVERTFEIGLRKAVGAKNSDILQQFLWEAVIITLVGGLIGIIFGIAVSYLISYVAALKGFKQNFVVPLNSIIIAFSFSTAVGLVFGIYPARKAAKLSPIEALVKE